MVSDDLKFKVGISAVLIVGAGLLAWLAWRKVQGAGADLAGGFVESVSNAARAAMDTVSEAAGTAYDYANAGTQIVPTPLNVIGAVAGFGSQIPYAAANAATRAATGEPDVTFGTKLFEWLNPEQVARERAMFSGLPTSSPTGYVSPGWPQGKPPSSAWSW